MKQHAKVTRGVHRHAEQDVQSSIQSLTVRVSWTILLQSLSYLFVLSTRVSTWLLITMTNEESLPFWKVNVPQEQWPANCPDFLSNISEKDRAIIGTPDEEYTLLTWPEVQELVRTTVLSEAGDTYTTDR